MAQREPTERYCPHCGSTIVEATATFCPNDGVALRLSSERGAEWVGRVLADRYRISRFLGAGGCAEVYAAEQLGSGRRVAIKLLNPVFAATPGAAERFRQEAELISLVAHPNIVAIHDFGAAEDGTPFMAMELLEGESLGQRLRAGPLSPRTALRLALAVCEGLAAAHERGVIHRDVKPDNLFLVGAGEGEPPTVKILDLGIARLLGPSAPDRRLTQHGALFGTPEYMSPEQITGREVGPPSDVYALACVIWETLFGAPPFSDVSYQAVLAQQVYSEPHWPMDRAVELELPREIGALLLRGLAKDPSLRPPTMLDFQRELSGLLGQLRQVAREGGQTLASASRAGHSQPAGAPVPTRVALGDAIGAAGEIATLAPDVYWVGRRHGAVLECNPYLRVFHGNDRDLVLLVDPGGLKDLDVVAAKVRSIIGSLERIDYVFLNHQDPDVSSSTPQLLQAAPGARLLCSEDTWRLVLHYGLEARRFLATDRLRGGELRLPTGHRLEFVPTPFCHFRGAVMLYDPEARVLFSGDLFGGAAPTPRLLAGDESWSGIEVFHQVYMPSGQAIRAAVGRVRRLDPPPRIIAPQHGAVFTGDRVADLLERMEVLRVGLDLEEHAGDREDLMARHVAAAGEILDALLLVSGEAAVAALLVRYAGDESFPSPFVIEHGRSISGFRVAPRVGLEMLARDVIAAADAASRGALDRVIRRAMGRHGIAPTTARFWLASAPPGTPPPPRR